MIFTRFASATALDLASVKASISMASHPLEVNLSNCKRGELWLVAAIPLA